MALYSQLRSFRRFLFRFRCRIPKGVVLRNWHGKPTIAHPIAIHRLLDLITLFEGHLLTPYWQYFVYLQEIDDCDHAVDWLPGRCPFCRQSLIHTVFHESGDTAICACQETVHRETMGYLRTAEAAIQARRRRHYLEGNGKI
jgi:hypothetical protein